MNMKHACILSIPFALATLLHGQGSSIDANNSASGVASLLASKFVQTKVSDCVSAQQMLWQNTTTLNYTSDGLSITGLDTQGLPWKTVIPASGAMKCEVWSAKLRHDFGEDLMVLNYGNSGGGYDNELTILFFDKNRRPVPWESNAAFTLAKKGIAQITRLDASGNAGIVVPIREGDQHDGYAYVNHLYTITNNSIEKIIGLKNGATWPIITGNSNGLIGNESNDAKSSILSSPQVAMDQSNESSITVLKKISEDDGDKLQLSNGSTIPIPHIVVTDDPVKGREIFFAQYVPDGVDVIIKDKYFITTQGLSCEEEECRPLILWGAR